QDKKKLKRWPKEVQSEIEQTLMEGAHGMHVPFPFSQYIPLTPCRFRWVVCQLDELQTCLNLRSLREALHSLPKNLDATYDRILEGIDKREHRKAALKILHWLAYSA